MRQMRIYADTSVFGGVFDAEFKEASSEFIGQVRADLIVLVVSAVVESEIQTAPQQVRALYESLSSFIERVPVGEQADDLQQAYLMAGVVSPKWETDALHVAIATVTGCRAIASWNFKHMVNLRRISLYNAVNLAEGYPPIAIHTPQEIRFDDTED